MQQFARAANARAAAAATPAARAWRLPFPINSRGPGDRSISRLVDPAKTAGVSGLAAVLHRPAMSGRGKGCHFRILRPCGAARRPQCGYCNPPEGTRCTPVPSRRRQCEYCNPPEGTRCTPVPSRRRQCEYCYPCARSQCTSCRRLAEAPFSAPPLATVPLATVPLPTGSPRDGSPRRRTFCPQISAEHPQNLSRTPRSEQKERHPRRAAPRGFPAGPRGRGLRGNAQIGLPARFGRFRADRGRGAPLGTPAALRAAGGVLFVRWGVFC